MESVRPKTNNAVRRKVLSIISDVQKRKDNALKEYETKFSGTQIRSLQITPQEIKSAYSKVKKEQIAGIKLAKT
ncbi:histidinol dehydrogenase, partial [Candidatus Nitrosotalea sp. FS]|uniref:histidinol dehydrogenase n=1 Tax=Candidatus Nitrosotalea sp. FS TaxID=2341021 RepID=UPI0021074BE2